MAQDVICEVQEGLATVTLNRPEALNAFSEEMLTEGQKIFEALSRDGAVRSVVLTGSGQNFSAGGDLADFKRRIESETYLTPDFIEKCAALAKSILTCSKPVIAMINGAAAGAGCGLALACDFRVMTEKSRLVMAFVNVAVAGDTGVLFTLPKLVGLGRAREMLMLGESIRGREAVALGLATRLAEEGGLAETTHALAAKLASLPPEALRRQKEMFFDQFYGNLPAYTRQEVANMVEGSQTADFAEAVHAFLEKRTPVFTGQ